MKNNIKLFTINDKNDILIKNFNQVLSGKIKTGELDTENLHFVNQLKKVKSGELIAYCITYENIQGNDYNRLFKLTKEQPKLIDDVIDYKKCRNLIIVLFLKAKEPKQELIYQQLKKLLEEVNTWYLGYYVSDQELNDYIELNNIDKSKYYRGELEQEIAELWSDDFVFNLPEIIENVILGDGWYGNC